MNAILKPPMLAVLENLVAYPEWESPEWLEAVALAIGETIKEVRDTNSELAARLAQAAAATNSAELERALNAALDACEASGTKQTSDAIRLRSIRDRQRLTRGQIESH